MKQHNPTPRRITRSYAKESQIKLFSDEINELNHFNIPNNSTKETKSKNMKNNNNKTKQEKSPSRIKSNTNTNTKFDLIKISQISKDTPTKKSFGEKLVDSEILEFKIQSSNEIPEIIYRKSGPFAYSFKPDKNISLQNSSEYQKSFTRNMNNGVTRSIKKNNNNSCDYKINQTKLFDKISKELNETGVERWFRLGYYILLIPFLMFTHQYYKKKFSWNSLPLNLESYITFEGFFLVFSLNIIQAFLLLFPIGKKVNNTNNELEYNFRKNGLFSIIISIGSLLMYHYYYKYPIKWIEDHFVPMLTSSCIFAVIYTIIIFICVRSSKSLSHSQSSPFIYLKYFFFGGEINPKLGSLDVKIFLLRIFTNTTILTNVLLFINNNNLRKEFWLDSSFLSTLFISLYILDIIWFEDYFITTFEYLKEDVGFIYILKYLVKPFSYIVLTRSLMQSKQNYSWYCILPIIIIYLLGYIIYRMSNLEKSKFRRNSLDRSIRKISTFPTITGKKLLIGSFWGFVRHPNYLGDILMHISMFSLLGTNHYLPYGYLMFYLIHLINRIQRIEKKCKNFYGIAWDRYCIIVNYKIIPGLF